MKEIYFSILFTFSSFFVTGQLVITEIMYNPPESGTDSLEYIEINNNSGGDLNLNGYSFSAGVIYTFDDVIMSNASYLIIAVDSAVALDILGVNALQWESGGLSNGGETIAIQNGNGTEIISVTYDDGNGWPTMDDGTDGGGASIELCSPDVDPSDPSNWFASMNELGIMINGRMLRGTPGTPSNGECPSNVAEVVEVSSFVFTPKDITINIGETVRWENKGGTHNVNGSTDIFFNNPESFLSGPPSSTSWDYEFTFTLPGVYDYQCDPHFDIGMVGTVTVLDPNASPPNLVITEIMYNDPAMFDSLEFIEILNIDDKTVNLNGVTFGSGPEFTFPAQELAPGEFVILAQDTASFHKYFEISAFQYEGDGLGSDGEEILLLSQSGDTIDIVSYTDRDPWPMEADGSGYSLVLCDEFSDNSDPSNWSISTTKAGFEYQGVQIFADPGKVSYCSMTIDMATRTDETGSALVVNKRAALEGVVYGNNFRPGGLQFTIIDMANDGIGVFSSTEQYGYTVAEGDSVTIFGIIDQFNGLIQIIPDDITMLGQNSALFNPTPVTMLNEDTESQLITIENVALADPAEWGGGGSGFNVEVSNGNETYLVRVDADIDLFNSNYPTGTFDITGIGGQFDSTSPYDGGYQLVPRYSADINPFNPFVEKFPLRSIAEMTTDDSDGIADSLNVSCSLTGVVYGINQRPSGLQFAIIDENNDGIVIFNSSGDLGYTVAEGDRITVKGTISQFSGLTQLNPEEISIDAVGVTLLDPEIVTTLDEATESSFIKMEAMTYVDPGQWRGDGSSFNVEIMDGAGNVFEMRIDNDTEMSTMIAPEAPFNITGIGGQFDGSIPHDEGYQILPRYITDFETTSSLENTLASAEFRIYPNPVSDFLTIDSDLDLVRVEIFSLDGRLLISNNDKRQDVSLLPEGIYMLRIETEKGGYIEKIIKK